MPHKDKEKRREYQKAWYSANKEKYPPQTKAYRDANKDKIAARNKEWREANKEKIAAQNKVRKASDPAFKALSNFRTRLAKFGSKARAKSKTPRFEYYFGCTPEQYVRYIEAQFLEGMTWDNYGDWQIDHILPLSLGINEFEWRMLNHYTNLRPMWATENQSKSDTLPDSFPPNFPYWQHFLQHFELAA